MIQEIQEKIADKTLSFGCLYRVLDKDQTIYPNEYTWFDNDGNLWYTHKDYGLYDNEDNNTMVNKEDYVVIWHPVSLSRVLSALGDDYYYRDDICKVEVLSLYDENNELYDEPFDYYVCKRQLLKEDWSDAYLQDQSDETIQELHGLLVR